MAENIDIHGLLVGSGLDRELFEQACRSAWSNGNLLDGEDEDEWDVLDDLASAIWFSGGLADLNRIRLQCELFDLAPAYSTGMYLGVPFPRLSKEAQRYFWSWALARMEAGVTTTSGSLVYVVAMDFEERVIPEGFLQAVELRSWTGWGVAWDWPSFVRQAQVKARQLNIRHRGRSEIDEARILGHGPRVVSAGRGPVPVCHTARL